MIKKLIKDLYQIRFAIIVLFLYCVYAQYNYDTVCPYKIITGMPCPACGLTHAAIYLIKGNITKAIYSNPTIFLWMALIIIFLIDRYIYKLKVKIFPFGVIAVGLITIFFYIYKIVLV